MGRRSARARSETLAPIELGLLALALVLFATGGLVSSTTAVFTGETTNGNNAFATTALYAPSGLAGSPVGHDVQLTWNSGQNGDRYAVLGVANGLSSACSGVVFTTPMTTTTAASYVDANRYLPEGTWFCYQVQTAYGPWTSVLDNPLAAVQIGVVANALQLVNAGNTSGCSGTGDQQFGQASTLDCGDQIVIGFNQGIDTSTGPASTDTVCTRQSNNTLWLGSPTVSGSCLATEAVNLGKLAGGGIGGCSCRFQATYTWGNGNKTLAVTIGRRVSGTKYPSVGSAIWTLTPTTDGTKLRSSPGGFHVCDSNTGGGNCLPGSNGTT